jgi:2',3'-cyclic-nucleotide 2'-phosphodiesterase / 3'-nucleotidase / 5'-nucleotidase
MQSLPSKLFPRSARAFIASALVISTLTNAFALSPSQGSAPLQPAAPAGLEESAGETAAEALSLTPNNALSLSLLGTYATGVYSTEVSAAEIVAHDPATQRLFIVNGYSRTIDIVNMASPATPTLISSVSLGAYGLPNSVAVKDGIVAAAVEAPVKTDPGLAVFMDVTGTLQSTVTVGALPDMIAFSPDGRLVLTANEGEPSAGVDPEGSVSAIDVSGGVASLQPFSATRIAFTGFTTATIDPRVRLISQTATIAQDLEPEYIAFSPDGKRAYVTLQENNAVAIIDTNALSVLAIAPLGFKNHAIPGNGLDASDQDGAINIVEQNVFGMYMPDGIATYDANGATYLITANEGDARSYDERRVGALTLDPTAFPDPNAIKAAAALGRLNVSAVAHGPNRAFSPDTDGDGDIDRLYSYGTRSFSIWDSAGGLVFDSGDHMERVISNTVPSFFNSDATRGRDGRSPAKGPEPESVVIGAIGGRNYAFVALERVGGVMVYDVTSPGNPAFVNYTNNRVYTTTLSPAAKDLGPEGLLFIPAAQSPNGKPLLIVANEVSGSTSIFQIDTGSDVTLLHTNDVHARVFEYNVNGSASCSGTSCIGGAARMSGIVKQVRGAISNTLLLDAGDQFQGTLYYNLFRSSAITLTMNALGYDAMAVGNHELDNGPAELRRLIDGATFPVLSANMDVANEPLLAGKIRAGAIVTTAGGERYGVVGVTTEDTAFLSSPGPTVRFTPHVSATQSSVNALLAQGVNRVIVLSHLGYDVDLRLARVITGADVIVGGHTHTFLYSPVTTLPNSDAAVGPYPTPVTAGDGSTVLVVQAFQWGRYLGRLNVRFTPDGRVSSWSGNPIYLDSTVGNDPAVTAIVSPTLSAPVAALRAQEVGSTTTAMPILSGTLQICRAQECVLGNTVADALLWKANQLISTTRPASVTAQAAMGELPFDFAIQNGGGLRAPIDPPTVTVGEILETLPFGNSMATFEITGTHVISSLESGLSNFGVSGNGRFPQVSGLRYYFDPAKPVGQRLLGVFVLGANGQYAPINPARIYRIVTNDFMRKGGDGYVLFRDAALKPYDFGPGVDEALAEYIATRPNRTISPALEGRIVQGPPPPTSRRVLLPIAAKQ